MRDGGVPLSLFVRKPASQANGHPKGFAHSSLSVLGIKLSGFPLKFLLNECYEHSEISINLASSLLLAGVTNPVLFGLFFLTVLLCLQFLTLLTYTFLVVF